MGGISKPAVWKFCIEHDLDSARTFTHAKTAFAELRRKYASTAEIEIGPMSEHDPNMVRVTVLGSEIIAGVLFRDGQTLVQVTVPKKVAWAKTLAEAKIREQTEKLLREAGATFVQIEEYS